MPSAGLAYPFMSINGSTSDVCKCTGWAWNKVDRPSAGCLLAEWEIGQKQDGMPNLRTLLAASASCLHLSSQASAVDALVGPCMHFSAKQHLSEKFRGAYLCQDGHGTDLTGRKPDAC